MSIKNGPVNPRVNKSRDDFGIRFDLLKALTRAIQENFPEAEYVRTQNAETNAPMVAINEAMGFEIHTVEGEFQKHLA